MVETMWNTIGDLLLGELIFILVICQYVTLFFTAYQAIISLIGMVKRKSRSKNDEAVGGRYALVVCAHNEEAVVGEIVKNLKQLDYPKHLYDIYVIADNCSDNTADVAEKHGAIAMRRQDREKKGKGYGIEWFLERLWQREQDGFIYDGVAIFDADNLVSLNFLKQADAKMKQGINVMQSYLDSKNPNDTWVTRSYAFSYWATSRIYQLARDNIGLSAQLGGTGMVFSAQVLKEMGWGAKSLTEDLEFTVKYLLERKQCVGWLHEAKIYDEKPLTLKPSYIQRIRWMKGHFDCAVRYFKPLLKFIFTEKKKRLAALDILIYLIQPVKIVLAMSGLGFFVLSIFEPLPEYIQVWVLNGYVWWSVLILYYIQPFWGLFLEKRFSKSWWFIQTYLFSLSWIPIVAYSFFKRKETTWNHTKHTRSISADEFSKQVNL
jgi:cellulose synthase/poly-beta-1,6-N-acetylglucosamine synthase-like glycosyltransferase